MARGIVKLGEEQYMEWSTVVDAPTSYIVPKQMMRDYLLEEGTKKLKEDIEERLSRADANETSFDLAYTIKDLVASNKAGDNGKKLSLKQIKEQFKWVEE